MFFRLLTLLAMTFGVLNFVQSRPLVAQTVQIENTATKSDALLLTNNTYRTIIARIYNPGDKVRSIAAKKIRITPGKTGTISYSKEEYWLRLTSLKDKDFFFLGRVTSGNGISVNRIEPLNPRFASLNVKLMPIPIGGYDFFQDGNGLSATRSERLAAMASFGTGFDVIGYQEVWRRDMTGDNHYVDLRDELMRRGFSFPNIVRGDTQGFERGYHHGLVIASKHPVVSKSEMAFDAEKGEDSIAEKGVLHARIDINGKLVSVFNTHLQAPVKSEARNDIRSKQLKEMAAFIQTESRGSEAVVVMGDFNVPRAPANAACTGMNAFNCRAVTCREPGKTASEYCQWFTNPNLNGNWAGYADYGLMNGEAGVVDYVLIRGPILSPPTENPNLGWVFSDGTGSHQTGGFSTPTIGNSIRHITDHPGVWASFDVGAK